MFLIGNKYDFNRIFIIKRHIIIIRQSSTASSLIFEFYIDQDSILLKRDIKKQLRHIFLEFCIDNEYNQIQKNIY